MNESISDRVAFDNISSWYMFLCMSRAQTRASWTHKGGSSSKGEPAFVNWIIPHSKDIEKPSEFVPF